MRLWLRRKLARFDTTWLRVWRKVAPAGLLLGWWMRLLLHRDTKLTKAPLVLPSRSSRNVAPGAATESHRAGCQHLSRDRSLFASGSCQTSRIPSHCVHMLQIESARWRRRRWEDRVTAHCWQENQAIILVSCKPLSLQLGVECATHIRASDSCLAGGPRSGSHCRRSRLTGYSSFASLRAAHEDTRAIRESARAGRRRSVIVVASPDLHVCCCRSVHVVSAVASLDGSA